MPPEAPAQTTIAIDPNLRAPNNTQIQNNNASPLPSSTAAPIGAPASAPRNTRPSWRAGNAMFDIQMNPYSAPGRGKASTCHTPPRVPAPSPSLGLNPYHDGRIRNAIPNKLKGKTNRKQGNFGVMQMHVQKPEMTERDLAAKRTSEGTAAAAKLAGAQRYVQPRRPRPRPRPQPAVAYPPPQTYRPIAPPAVVPVASIASMAPIAVPPQHRSQPPPVLPATPRPIAQPPPLASAKPQDKPLYSRTGVVEVIHETNIGQTDDPSKDTDNKQTSAPFSDLEDTQDVEMGQSDEPLIAAGLVEETVMPREANAEQTASSENNPVHPLPTDAKREQARLLKLLQSISPVAVVNQLCKALIHFGGTPNAPPPPDGSFPKSVSSNGSGDLFISWASEVFPSTLALLEPAISQSMVQPQPLARPRGRPKGSKNSSRIKATHTVSTTFVPLTMPSNGVGTVEMQPPPVENDTSAAQKSAANNQNSDAPPLPSTNYPSQTSTAPSTALRPLLPLPAQPVRPVVPLIPKIKRTRRLQILPIRKPTGRPRGRPKGSKNQSRRYSGAQNGETDQSNSHSNDSKDISMSRSTAQPDGVGQPSTGSSNIPEVVGDNPSRGTIGATQEATSTLLHNSEESRTEAVTGNANAIDHQPRVPKTNEQRAVQVSSGKRKGSQQTVHSGTQALDITQVYGATTRPVDEDNQLQQVKRRRVSQETGQRGPATGDSSFYSANTVTQQQQYTDTSPVRSSQSPQIPSSVVNRPRNQLPGAPNHVSTDMTAVALYQRQQQQQHQRQDQFRLLTSHSNRATEQPFARTTGSSSPIQFQGLDNRPFLPPHDHHS